MALSLSTLNGHLTRIITDLPVTFIWNGVSYQAVRSSPTLSQTLEVGGIDEKIEFQLFVKADALPTIKPHEGAIFTIDGIKMRVLEVKKSPDDAQLLSFALGFARQQPSPYLT